MVLVITAIVVWQGFFKEEEVSVEEEVILIPEREIEINYGVLESQILEKLQSFTEIEPFEEIPLAEGEEGEEIGRENPFSPY